mmetsp:Transcript_23026/g.61086  ORF Transcript_23026/g.61086 Transcript_23026/m.61086 type:complete len:269 (+) Transcript_23026:47-853(+)
MASATVESPSAPRSSIGSALDMLSAGVSDDAASTHLYSTLGSATSPPSSTPSPRPIMPLPAATISSHPNSSASSAAPPNGSTSSTNTLVSVIATSTQQYPASRRSSGPRPDAASPKNALSRHRTLARWSCSARTGKRPPMWRCETAVSWLAGPVKKQRNSADAVIDGIHLRSARTGGKGMEGFAGPAAWRRWTWAVTRSEHCRRVMTSSEEVHIVVREKLTQTASCGETPSSLGMTGPNSRMASSMDFSSPGKLHAVLSSGSEEDSSE